MPGDGFAVVRHFAEEMRAPADDVFAEDVAHDRDDGGMREQVVNASVCEVCGADGVGVAACGDDLGEQGVKVSAKIADFGFAENADLFEIAIAIVSGDVRRRQRLRMGRLTLEKAKVADKRLEILLLGYGFELHASTLRERPANAIEEGRCGQKV